MFLDKGNYGFNIFGFVVKLFSENYSIREGDEKTNQKNWEELAKKASDSVNVATKTAKDIDKSLNDNSMFFSNICECCCFYVMRYIDAQKDAKVLEYTQYKETFTELFFFLRNNQALFEQGIPAFINFRVEAKNFVKKVSEEYQEDDKNFADLIRKFVNIFYKAEREYQRYLLMSDAA